MDTRFITCVGLWIFRISAAAVDSAVVSINPAEISSKTSLATAIFVIRTFEECLGARRGSFINKLGWGMRVGGKARNLISCQLEEFLLNFQQSRKAFGVIVSRRDESSIRALSHYVTTCSLAKVQLLNQISQNKLNSVLRQAGDCEKAKNPNYISCITIRTTLTTERERLTERKRKKCSWWRQKPLWILIMKFSHSTLIIWGFAFGLWCKYQSNSVPSRETF